MRMIYFLGNLGQMWTKLVQKRSKA